MKGPIPACQSHTDFQSDPYRAMLPARGLLAFVALPLPHRPSPWHTVSGHACSPLLPALRITGQAPPISGLFLGAESSQEFQPRCLLLPDVLCVLCLRSRLRPAHWVSLAAFIPMLPFLRESGPGTPLRPALRRACLAAETSLPLSCPPSGTRARGIRSLQSAWVLL